MLTARSVGAWQRRVSDGWFDADEEGISSLLPVAVDVFEADLAQPPQLRLDVEQAVGGILVLERLANRREESN